MSTIEFQVTGMTCSHCEASVREEVSEVAGIESIEVSAETGRLVVTGTGEIDAAAVTAAVTEAGYQATRA